MNSVKILYFTDNNDGMRIANAISELGLSIQILSLSDIVALPFERNIIPIIIVDIEKASLSQICSTISGHNEFDTVIKFFVLKTALISKALEESSSIPNLEIVEKPYNQREFILLLEKTIVVEKYREIMRQLSLEYEKRLDNYERIFSVEKKELVVNENNEYSFQRIIEFEQNLIKKQNELNQRLQEFSFSRQKDLLDTKNMLFAKDMLDQLREKELLDANQTINAQEKVIEFSSHEIDEKSKLLEAHEKVVELSREEAIRLHHTIEALQKEKHFLQEENENLKKEIFKEEGE